MQKVDAQRTVWQRNLNFAAQPSAAKERGVEHVRAVRGTEDEHSWRAAQTVHLLEELIDDRVRLRRTSRS